MVDFGLGHDLMVILVIHFGVVPSAQVITDVTPSAINFVGQPKVFGPS